jgi:hypothetical protein
MTERYLCQHFFVLRPQAGPDLTAQVPRMRQRQTDRKDSIMRGRFSRALYAVAAAAVVAGSLSLSAGVASAAPHINKGTVACGGACINLFAAQLGSNVTLNAFVPGDTGTGGRVGQKVNMRLAGNFRPNGDWEPDLVGFVSEFCGTAANDFFLPTSYVCLNYPNFPVFELSWSPFGNQSNLCAGVRTGGVSGENVTLQDCGVSANTVWIVDQNNSTTGGSCLSPATPPVGPGVDPSVTYCPWINGGDTRFSQPLVLTLNAGSSNPQNQLLLRPETKVGGEVRTDQLFAFYFGAI